jgi:hypothetical protein
MEKLYEFGLNPNTYEPFLASLMLLNFIYIAERNNKMASAIKLYEKYNIYIVFISFFFHRVDIEAFMPVLKKFMIGFFYYYIIIKLYFVIES